MSSRRRKNRHNPIQDLERDNFETLAVEYVDETGSTLEDVREAFNSLDRTGKRNGIKWLRFRANPAGYFPGEDPKYVARVRRRFATLFRELG